jgi:glycosyltransferase involved in cell wall biosynthesis
MNVRASIIIPTYNKLSRLRLTLSAFEFQTFTDFEVVVCDDGSTDDTLGVLSRMRTSFPLRVVSGPHRGAGVARNRAVEGASGDVLIFNDDDMVPVPDFVAAHVKACEEADVLSRGPRWSMPIAQVPSFLEGDLNPARYVEVWQTARLTVAEHWTFYSLMETPMHPYRFLQACTSNLGVRKESFVRIGAFNETFGTGWGAEDTEFGYRAQLNNIDIRLEEAAMNLHLEHSIDSGKKFEVGLRNYRKFLSLYPNNRDVRALYAYVEHAITAGNARELFDEQTFVDRRIGNIENMGVTTS